MISTIISLYNKYDNIGSFYRKIHHAIKIQTENFEIVLINAVSSDQSEVLSTEIAQKASHLNVIKLRKNFNHTASIMAGVHFIKG